MFVTVITIDQDHTTTPPARRRWRGIIAATAGAVIVLAIAAAIARPAPADPPIRTHVVTVLAIPADGAAAQVVPADGQPITPRLGAPVQLDARPASISVLARATASGATCVIWMNGVVVASDLTAVEGQPASCMWSE